MINNEDFYWKLREALPSKPFEKEGEWEERAAYAFKLKKSRIQAFKYGKTVAPRHEEIIMVQSLVDETTNTVARVRALANETLARGERLKDEEKQQWENVLQQLVNLRSSIHTAH